MENKIIEHYNNREKLVNDLEANRKPLLHGLFGAVLIKP